LSRRRLLHLGGPRLLRPRPADEPAGHDARRLGSGLAILADVKAIREGVDDDDKPDRAERKPRTARINRERGQRLLASPLALVEE
jgi:hypothetical protein